MLIYEYMPNRGLDSLIFGWYLEHKYLCVNIMQHSVHLVSLIIFLSNEFYLQTS